MRHIHHLLLCTLIIGLIGCSIDDQNDADELRDNPEEVQVDDLRLQLNTHIWRDTTDQGTPTLKSIVRLTEADSASIDRVDFNLIRQFVIVGLSTWEANIQQVEQLHPYEIQGQSINGPPLEPGISVDVVLKFTYKGDTFNLLAREQTIHDGL